MDAAGSANWKAMIASATPFVVTPWVLLFFLREADDLYIAIGIFFFTSIAFIILGSIGLYLALKYLRHGPQDVRERRMGAGILMGMSLGFNRPDPGPVAVHRGRFVFWLSIVFAAQGSDLRLRPVAFPAPQAPRGLAAFYLMTGC